MQSNGGLARVREIDREAASTVMSGPVGGVVACRVLGSGTRTSWPTDMGGTSFEVGLILDGEAHIANTTWIGRHEIALPSVSVRTVGAGSGLDRRRRRTGCCAWGRRARAPCPGRPATAAAASGRPWPTPTSCSAI